MSSTIEETGAEQSLTSTQAKFSFAKFVRTHGGQIGILGVFLGMWLFFIIAAPETFLSPQIYRAFMSTIPFFAIVALPLTVLIIAGEIDLSFPSIMAIGMVSYIGVFDATGSIVLAIPLSSGLVFPRWWLRLAPSFSGAAQFWCFWGVKEVPWLVSKKRLPVVGWLEKLAAYPPR
jgi:ribose/xylose/arabinose/galactoside ABC-type transport system permease subunit